MLNYNGEQMKKVYSCHVEINGNSHAIEFDRSEALYHIKVDGITVATHKRRLADCISYFYIPFQIDGEPCYLLTTTWQTEPRLLHRTKSINGNVSDMSLPHLPFVFWIMLYISIAITAIDVIVSILGRGFGVLSIVPILQLSFQSFGHPCQFLLSKRLNG